MNYKQVVLYHIAISVTKLNTPCLLVVQSFIKINIKFRGLVITENFYEVCCKVKFI